MNNEILIKSDFQEIPSEKLFPSRRFVFLQTHLPSGRINDKKVVNLLIFNLFKPPDD